MKKAAHFFLVSFFVVFLSLLFMYNDFAAAKAEPAAAKAAKTARSMPLKAIKPVRADKALKLQDSPRLTLPIPVNIKYSRTSKGNNFIQNFHTAFNMPAAEVSFDGISNVDSKVPPDTNGDVGPGHYVQTVNNSIAVYDKSGTVLSGPTSTASLFSALGGSCETHTNNEHPIVLYDHMADRWFVAIYAAESTTGPHHFCLAVSQTKDPQMQWYLYDFTLANNLTLDSPKYGVWPNGYYMSVNQWDDIFTVGVLVAAFERDKMLTGDPTAQMVTKELAIVPGDPDNKLIYSLLPSDLDGFQLPSEDSPNYYAMVWDAELWGFDPEQHDDRLFIFEFDIDYDTPGNSTFTTAADINLDDQGLSYLSACFDPDSFTYGPCVPQPNTDVKLDSVSDRLMHRLQYRKFGDDEVLAATHTVDANNDINSLDAGIQWYEIRKTDGSWSINQGGTYAPDSEFRWLGSIASDVNGNIAVGYSVSSSSVAPSIRYAGRLTTDDANTLGQDETKLIDGSGSQTGGTEWGTYSMMSVDPVDGCTFWYTNEYYGQDSASGWKTKIGSFSFDECNGGPKGTIEGTVTDDYTGEPIEGAAVKIGIYPDIVTTDENGNYFKDEVPVGTYTVTVSIEGYLPISATVNVTDGDTVTQDLALNVIPLVTISGTVTDDGIDDDPAQVHGWPLYAKIDYVITDGGTGTIYTDAENGTYSIDVQEDQDVTFTINAVFGGYIEAVDSFTVPKGDQTRDYKLKVDKNECSALGYKREFQTSFDSGVFPPEGWTVVDNAGNGLVWMLSSDWGDLNYTSGKGEAAEASSHSILDEHNKHSFDTELVTPVISVTLEPVKFIMRFFANYQDIASDGDHLDLRICAPGTQQECDPESTEYDINASAWKDIFSWDEDHPEHPEDHPSPSLFSLPGEKVTFDHGDIASLLDGSTTFRLSWHYYDNPGSVYDWYAQVDDLGIGLCIKEDGGLVAGNVYDANDGSPIKGAEVDAGSDYNTITGKPDPEDNNVGDGFFVFFSPSGNRTITGSAVSYANEDQTVYVPDDAPLAIDFSLTASALSVNPSSIVKEIGEGDSTVVQISLENNGDEEASYAIYEGQITKGPKSKRFFAKPEVSNRKTGKGVWLDTKGVEIPQGPANFQAFDKIKQFEPRAFKWMPLKPAAEVNILVYADDTIHHFPNTYPDKALQSLGLPYTAYYGNWEGFEAALTDGTSWDLVIVANDSGVPTTSALDELNTYVTNGGKFIYSGIAVTSVHDLWTKIGISIKDEDTDPPDNVYWWEPEHAFFNVPQSVPEFESLDSLVESGISVYGQSVEPLAGFKALAGYNGSSPTTDMAALVYGPQANNSCSIFKGFIDAHNSADLDSDSIPDGVELWINMIQGISLCTQDIAWLSESPASGKVAGNDTEDVNVTLDTASLPLGEHSATLFIDNNSPYGEQTINVTLTVIPKYALTFTKDGTGTGSVTSTSPASIIDCDSSCTEDTADVNEGTEVTLTDVPDAGSNFTGWSGGCTGKGDCVVTMNNAVNVTATFDAKIFHTLTVNKTGTGAGRVLSDIAGIDCGTATEECTEDYEENTVVNLTAASESGSAFIGWTGECTVSNEVFCQITMDKAQTVEAQFDVFNTTTFHDLTVTKDGTGTGTVTSLQGGLDCGDTCTINYPEDQTVVLSAAPDSGSMFIGWSDTADCSGTGNCAVTIDTAKTINATFNLENLQLLTINKTGDGTGKVVSDPAGIDCGDTCSSNFEFGKVVTLTAAAETGSIFKGWTGGCTGSDTVCRVIMDEAEDVTAIFDLPAVFHTLFVSKAGSGTGTVASLPKGVECGADCLESKAYFEEGTLVKLDARASENSAFAGWSGVCQGTGSCEVTMDESRTVIANFVHLHTIAVEKIGSGTGTVTSETGIECSEDCSEENVQEGTVVTLTAIPDEGSAFLAWSDECTVIKGNCVVTITEELTITAQFEVVHALNVSIDEESTGEGSVLIIPDSISCGDDCTESYLEGTQILLVPFPRLTEDGEKSIFAGWTGACIDFLPTESCELTMDEAKTTVARFVKALTTYEGTIGTMFTIDIKEGESIGVRKPRVYVGDRDMNKWKKVKRISFDAINNTVTCLVKKMHPALEKDKLLDIWMVRKLDDKTADRNLFIDDVFKYKDPQIDTVEPAAGTAGDEITLKGSFFGNDRAKPKVFLKSGDTEVKCKTKIPEDGWNSTTGASTVNFIVHKKALKAFAKEEVVSIILSNKIGEGMLLDSFTIQ